MQRLKGLCGVARVVFADGHVKFTIRAETHRTALMRAGIFADFQALILGLDHHEFAARFRHVAIRRKAADHVMRERLLFHVVDIDERLLGKLRMQRHAFHAAFPKIIHVHFQKRGIEQLAIFHDANRARLLAHEDAPIPCDIHGHRPVEALADRIDEEAVGDFDVALGEERERAESDEWEKEGGTHRDDVTHPRADGEFRGAHARRALPLDSSNARLRPGARSFTLWRGSFRFRGRS